MNREEVMKEVQLTVRSMWGCCMHNPEWDADDITEVLATAVMGYYGDGWQTVEQEGSLTGSEVESYTLVKLKSGEFGVFGSSEDYTGHGCQCSSFTTRHTTVEDALKFGVGITTREDVRGPAECIKEQL